MLFREDGCARSRRISSSYAASFSAVGEWLPLVHYECIFLGIVYLTHLHGLQVQSVDLAFEVLRSTSGIICGLSSREKSVLAASWTGLSGDESGSARHRGQRADESGGR